MALIISHAPEETFEIGRRFAEGLRPGDVLALSGDLGAGKTHFSKGIAAGLGIAPEEVTSPTFTLIHEYRSGRLPLHHIDLYRIESAPEALDLGLDDYLGHGSGGVTVIEWADKFAALIPGHARWVRFRVLEGDQREIEL